MARVRNTTDEQILDQARACFLEHGASVSTTVIAERLGISHGVLFQRFGTKEQLLLAALLPREQPFIALARLGPDERDVRIQLLELALEISKHLERIVPCLAVLRSAGVNVERIAQNSEEAPPVRARREVKEWFERAFARGLLRPVPPQHAADLFLGALHVRPFHRHLWREVIDPSENRAYLEFAVEALCRTLAPDANPG